ncbi:hypothetical protein OF83DRAFT_1168415 [Amylostereum chailletii]|nr:hypothetical protein OF83DRAFT_1168415 [Amylostereum chailletii]
MSMALSIESNIKRADSSTIQNKFLVGYQGWFHCPGDGEPVGPGHHGWIHWFDFPVPDGGNINIDNWPDTSECAPDELFAAPGFKHEDGSQAHLFSSRHPKTVQRHFHWMAQNGVDGAFLQRFLGCCDIENGENQGVYRIRDEVGDLVKDACEKEGRVYAIMYDLAGVAPERTQRIIERDWLHLIHDKHILDSPNYLCENGKPVIAIWGFGFEHTHHTIELLRSVTSFIRNNTPGGAYIMAGGPSQWRTCEGDADKNSGFTAAWMECFDAISPWTVGRYSDQQSADWFAENRVKGDIEFIQQWEREKGKHVDYIPVVHPGGSGHNTSKGQWKRNDAPRNGGRYLWRQLYNVRKHGAKIMYGAMWDEYDEGTNFMPVVEKVSQLPHDDARKFKFLAYDIDGYDVPSDWYMRIAGYAAEALKGERSIEEHFPEKELRDWKSSHPRYETRPPGSGASGSGTGDGQGYVQWPQDSNVGDEPPPPPYTVQVTGGQASIESPRPALPASTRPHPPPVRQGLRPSPGPTLPPDPIHSLTDHMSRHEISSTSIPPPPIPSSRPSSYPPPQPQPHVPVLPPSQPQSLPPPLPPSRPPHTMQNSYPPPPPSWPPAEWGPHASPPPPPPHHAPYTGPSTFTYPEQYYPPGPLMPSELSMPSGPSTAPWPGGLSMPSPSSPSMPTPGDGSGYQPSYTPYPPPVPPRPPIHPGSSSYGQPQVPPPVPQRAYGNDALGYARDTLGRFTNEDTRNKLGKGVGSLRESGAKIFNRFK